MPPGTCWSCTGRDHVLPSVLVTKRALETAKSSFRLKLTSSTVSTKRTAPRSALILTFGTSYWTEPETGSSNLPSERTVWFLSRCGATAGASALYVNGNVLERSSHISFASSVSGSSPSSRPRRSVPAMSSPR